MPSTADNEDVLAFLIGGVAALGIHLNSRQLNQFFRYQELVVEWSRRFNLTTITDPAEIQVRHFLDSLSCATITGDLNEQSLIDVGSGAGFPGVPLKICYPGLHLALVDSVAKKAGFLTILVQQLALDDTVVLKERAEILGQNSTHRGQYDWAVARALASMPTLAEYLLPFCRLGGHMLAMKGRRAQTECDAAADAIRILGGGRTQVQAAYSFEPAKARHLVVVEKVGQTPAQFPRRPGVPAKRPL